MKPSSLTLLGSIALLAAPPCADQAVAAPTQSGKELYTRHCSSCHSMTPPPLSAPPIIGLAYFYHKAFTNPEEGINHIMDFVATPAQEKSKLRPPAIPRFGLMPPIRLDTTELRTVSTWLWEQYDPKFTPPDCPE